MAQNDLVIANQSFPSFRTDLNSALQAINTSQSGTSRPSGAVAGTIWLDTTSPTTPTLKYYDGADDISLATLDHSANTVNWLDSTVSITGLTTTATGTVLTLSDSATTSTVNLIIDNDKEIRFREATANGTNYVSLSAPASLSADLTFTLPSADGISGQALVTNGSGVLSFTSALGNISVGTDNVALGTGALDDGSLTGGCNVAIGTNALTLNTTGNSNTAVGVTSLCANIAGSSNTAVGNTALLCNTCGCNTAIGAAALAANTTAVCNTAIGINAGCTITTGGCNTIVGTYTGCSTDLDIRTKGLFTVLSAGNGEPVFSIKSISGATNNTSYRLMKANHAFGHLVASGTIAAAGNVIINSNGYGGNGSIGIFAIVTAATDASAGFDSTFIQVHNHGSAYNNYGTALLYTTVNSITIVNSAGSVTITNGSAKEIKYQSRYLNLGAKELTLAAE
jgi:hypothetical protein